MELFKKCGISIEVKLWSEQKEIKGLASLQKIVSPAAEHVFKLRNTNVVKLLLTL